MPYEITVDQIRARTNAQTFARGQTVYLEGLIFDPVQRGDEIEAQCEASSQPEPYRLRAKLMANGIAETSCTCPYEYGDDCKHIVALLLTYLNTPASFDQRTPIADTLADRSKDELIALIRRMIKRCPDLQTLVDQPRPGKKANRKPVDTTVFHKELRRAFHAEYESGNATAAHALESVLDTANEFAASGDWHNASAIYRAAIEEFVEILDYQLPDDDGDFGELMNAVVDQLAECLNQPALANNDDERRAALNALVSVCIWNANMGGMGIGDMAEDYILRAVRQSDLPEIRERLTAEQRRHQTNQYTSWMAQDYASFLVQLDTLDNVDPETTLARLRDEGMYALLVRKLLELKRADEAVAVIEQQIVNPYERLHELPRLVDNGRGDDAVRLAEATLQDGYNDQLAAWLIEQYKGQHDQKAVLRLLQERMAEHPSEAAYAELKTAAEALGQWPKIRPALLSALELKSHLEVLTQIYLHDSNWDAAWATLEKYKQSKAKSKTLATYFGPWAYRSLESEVVNRSAAARPKRAIPVLTGYVRAEIDQRDRSHYHAAAELLLTLRELYHQVNDGESFRKLAADLRAEFKQLPAFQDEMNKAGL